MTCFLRDVPAHDFECGQLFARQLECKREEPIEARTLKFVFSAVE
jgi:hypothetical protein